jgi:CheY-specific phosphatase CheX
LTVYFREEDVTVMAAPGEDIVEVCVPIKCSAQHRCAVARLAGHLCQVVDEFSSLVAAAAATTMHSSSFSFVITAS